MNPRARPGDSSGLLALLIVAGTSHVHRKRHPVRHPHGVRRHRGHALRPGPALRSGPGIRSSSSTPHSLAVLHRRDLPDQRQPRPDRRLLHQVAGEGRRRCYFHATGGDEDIAGERLSEIVKDGIKSVVAQRTLQQIVAGERAAVTGEMLGQASTTSTVSASTSSTCACSASTCPRTSARGLREHEAELRARSPTQLRAEGQSESATHPRRGRAPAHRDHRRRRARRAAYPWRG